ncbi:MAG: hypothetical protein IPL79_18470 [Myxococcales bacterium]|nr:hypothetical protein [Myxococcales bacterium]
MNLASGATILLLALCLALLGWWLAARMTAWRRSAHARRRARIAQAGEQGAAALLEQHGYAIVAGQTRHHVTYLVDEVPHHAVLQCDYVVARDGIVFVAEVKTGDLAPQLQTAATRRQLLEYQVAFAVPGIVLIDMARGTCAEVRFALPAVRGAMA